MITNEQGQNKKGSERCFHGVQEGFPQEKFEMGLEGCVGVGQVAEEAVCTKEQSVERQDAFCSTGFPGFCWERGGGRDYLKSGRDSRASP